MKSQVSDATVAIIVAASALIFSTGCNSKKSSLLPPGGLDFPGQTRAPIPANYSNLPKADSNVPDAQFVDLKSGDQIGALFYALSNTPPNYEQLAMAASQEYRSTSDAFRKRDLMQALKPQIDQQILSYKDPRNCYFSSKINNGLPLGHYDFKTSSFPITQDLSPDTYRYFNDGSNWTYLFTNGAAFQRFQLSDEQRAKDIEDLITKGLTWQGDAVAYMFAQGADTANNRVLMQIVRMVLHGPEQSEVGRYEANPNPVAYPPTGTAPYKFSQ